MAGDQVTFAELVWPVVEPEVAPGARVIIRKKDVNQLNEARLGTKDVKGAVRAWIDHPVLGLRPMKWMLAYRTPGKDPYKDFTVRKDERVSEGVYREAEYYPLARCLDAGLLQDMVTVRAALADDGHGNVLEVALCRTATLAANCREQYVETNRFDGNHFYAVPFTAIPDLILWRTDGHGGLVRCEHVYQTALFG
jgi:hypothetical protein